MFAVFILSALIAQVTPAPSPPPLATPIPSPSPAATAPAPGSPAPGSPAPGPSAPVLAAAPQSLALHPLQSQTVTITGGVAPFSVSIDNPAIVGVAIDQQTATLTVSATQQTGAATIRLADSAGAFTDIPVRVALDAGSVPAALTLRITGTQVDTQWLTLQIQKALLGAARVQPGAIAQIDPFTLPALVGPGASAVIPVPVHIAGAGTYFDVNAFTSVTLQNVDVAPFDPPLLFYDDDPERIDSPGVLFSGTVVPGTPARLYYYHENRNTPMRLAVVFTSASAQPSSVQLIDASAGPNIDVMGVGHAVTRDFLLQKPLNEGLVVDVSAQNPYVADAFSLGPLDGAAGTIGVRVLSGAPVNAVVIALPATTSDAQIASSLALPRLPDDGHHRTGIFDIANYGQSYSAYTAGGPDVMLDYGVHSPPLADPPGDPLAQGHDFGQYGVLRTMTFDLGNPGDTAQTAYLYERPLGGVVRSSFLVNGVLQQVGCARVSNRYQIGPPIVVGPQGDEKLTVLTMTDGGSNYPLEVGLTATPPIPSPPPIAAPDGCFPKATPSPQPEPTG